MGVGQNINALLFKFDITPDGLARIAGVSKSTVSRWRHGNPIRQKNLEAICEFFDLVPDDILSDRSGLASKMFSSQDDPYYVETPLYGSISAGTPIDMIEVEDSFPIPRAVREKYPDAFLLKVEGESMNIDFKDGSYVLVDPCKEVTMNGQPYAVCVNGYAATVKRVYKLGNGFELRPNSTDPTYRPKVYDFGDEDTETVEILGRIVWDTKPVSWSY